MRVRSLVLLALLSATVSVTAQQAAAPAAPPKRVNPAIARLETGGIVDGEVLSFIDMEHNPYIIQEVRERADAAAARRKPDGMLEKAPVVRIPMYGFEPPAWAALQVLDLGALGVVFQSIETKAQAERAIGAMRFPSQKGSGLPTYPKGYRSGAPRGGKTLAMSADELLKRADVWPLNPAGELMAILMIETADGVKNLDQILAVPGISSILVGSYDLSLSLGVGPPKNGANPYAPETEAAIATIAKACARHKVVCGIAAGGGAEYRKKLIDMGYRLFLN